MAEEVKIIIGAYDKFSKTFGKLTSGLPSIRTLSLAASGAVTALGGSLLAMAKTTATTYDHIGKFSDRIGISTEALSKYRHVADLSGISAQQLQMGFQRMTRRISEASVGTGVAQNALKELGISIDSIASKKPDEQFEAIAAKLSEVGNQSDKVRLAMQFFDSEGVALLQTMKDGTAGLEAMKQEAEKFGLVVSEKAAANAARFNDSLTRLTGSLTGVKNAIAEKLLPTFSGFANKIATDMASNRQAVVNWAEAFLVAMGNVVEYGGYGVALLADSFRGWQMIWQTLKVSFAELSITLNEGIDFLVSKFAWMLEKINFRGIFDNDIALLNSVKQNAQDTINEMVAMKETALASLTAVAAKESAFERVRELKEYITNAMAEIRAAGMGGEGKEAQGVGMFSNKNIEKTKENVDVLKEMWNQYVLDDLERLDLWYTEQHQKHVKNWEDQIKLTTIYTSRLAKLKQRRDKDDVASEQWKSQALIGLQKTGATRGFRISQLANISQIKADTQAGAIAAYRAMAGIPIVGPALGAAAAAAVIAYGLSRLGVVQALGLNVAHGGLTNVPKESTYLLDRGERVLSAKQNQDVMDFINKGGGGTNVTIEKVEINMQESIKDLDHEEFAAEYLLPAFSELAKAGFKITDH